MRSLPIMKVVLIIFAGVCPYFLFSQSSENKTILQLNDKKFEFSDFKKYCKNNNYAEDSKNSNIEQYFDSYIIYCLKLTEAENEGIDQTPRFRREMEKFRNEIAAPYLNSNLINEELVNREWERLKEVNEISNILIPIPINNANDNSKETLPKDTLASYLKAMEIYSMSINDNFFNSAKDSDIEYKPYEVGAVKALTLPMNIEDAVYGMKVDDISKPIRTQYGYHIVKVNKRSEESQTTFTPQIKTNIIDHLKQSVPTLYYHPNLEKMKAVNKFLPQNELYSELRIAAEELYPTSKAFLSRFETDKRTLFTAQDHTSTVMDFILYLRQTNKGRAVLSVEVLDEKLRMFEYSTLSDLENRLLEVRYPEVIDMIEECRKNLLMLGLTDRETREKAQSDTLGLKDFFEKNRTKYSWKKPRFKGFAVHAQTIGATENIQKEIEKMDLDSAYSYLHDTYLPKGKKPEIKIGNKGIFIEGKDEYIDELIFKSSKKGIPYLEYPRYFVVGKLIEQPESYVDVLSFVLDDYQKYLEKNWIESLRKKYTIKINKKLIKELQ